MTTTEGTDAYYSPIPGPPAYVAPASAPWASPNPAERPTAGTHPWPIHQPLVSVPGFRPPTPTTKKQGRGPLILVVVVVAILGLIIAAGVGGTRYVSGTKRVGDDQGRVSISVPRTWTGTTDEELAADGYTPPVLEFSDFLYENGVRVYLEPTAPGDTPADEHRSLVDDLCDDLECVDPGVPTPVQIDGLPGLQTVLEGPYGTDVVTTVITGSTLVSLEAETSAYAPDPDVDRLIRIASSLSIHR